MTIIERVRAYTNEHGMESAAVLSKIPEFKDLNWKQLYSAIRNIKNPDGHWDISLVGRFNPEEHLLQAGKRRH